MKKIILYYYYCLRMTIIEIRLFFLKNHLEFLEHASWQTSHTWKKISRLQTKLLIYQIKIYQL